jgi:uncharacterized glyoxalase superfamily protein PhnB
VPAAAPAHPIWVVAIDHVVAMSPALDRTVRALQAAGLELRRIREQPTPAGAPRQAFFRLKLVPRVKPNRSIPAPTVIPVLIYPDVREAVDWLGTAFGFVERVRIGEDHRSQLSFGEGAVIVGDVRSERRPPRPGEVTHSVMVRVENADAHCERARAHGARIVMEPTDFPYGERQYTVEDPAGHQWTFSQTLADVVPEDWGGTTVAPISG